MDEEVYGLDAAGVEQIRTDHELLRSMVNVPVDRRFITRHRGGGKREKPYIITQKSDGSPPANIAIYGPQTPASVTCKIADGATDSDPTDDDVDVIPSITNGVTFTGCLCWAMNIDSTLYIRTAEGGHVFSGTATEDISPGSSGVVSLSYVDHFGVNQTADVTAINDFIGLTAQSGSSVVVQFLFGPSVVDGTSRFRISEIGCP